MMKAQDMKAPEGLMETGEGEIETEIMMIMPAAETRNAVQIEGNGGALPPEPEGECLKCN